LVVEMRINPIVLTFAFALVSPTVAHACRGAEYDGYLKALSALTPAVNVDYPEQSALTAFFEALPPNFSCFNRLFGYLDSPAPLYASPELHDLFPKIALVVPQHEYVKKLIGLSVNARWEADQTGALLHSVRAALDSNPRLFVSVLSELSPEAERSVWLFLFDAPHPSNQPLSRDVRKVLCRLSARSCKLSKEIYALAVRGKETH
jgi:hypothetical protein